MAAEVGQKAPQFTLVSTDLKATSLTDFAGKNVVLAFYPAAFTGVCQKEMCTFRDALNDYTSAKTAVLGVSVDSPFANKEFASKNGINFPLLSDITRDVIKQYDVVFNDLAGGEGLYRGEARRLRHRSAGRDPLQVGRPRAEGRAELRGSPERSHEGVLRRGTDLT